MNSQDSHSPASFTPEELARLRAAFVNGPAPTEPETVHSSFDHSPSKPKFGLFLRVAGCALIVVIILAGYSFLRSHPEIFKRLNARITHEMVQLHAKLEGGDIEDSASTDKTAAGKTSKSKTRSRRARSANSQTPAEPAGVAPPIQTEAVLPDPGSVDTQVAVSKPVRDYDAEVLDSRHRRLIRFGDRAVPVYHVSVDRGSEPMKFAFSQTPSAPTPEASQSLTPQQITLPPDANIRGSVVLEGIINKDGTVEGLKLVSGAPSLLPAAIEAASKWHYEPFVLNGEPIVTETQIVVNFSISRK